MKTVRMACFGLAFVGLLLVAGWAAASPYSAAVMADAPVGYWRLDEGAGTAANSGTAGALLNATYYNAAGTGSSLVGDTNASSSFNGIQSAAGTYLDGVGMNSVGGGNPFSGDWTIEGWYVRDTRQSWAGLVSNNGPGASAPLLTMLENSSSVGINGAGVAVQNVSVDPRGPSFGKPIYVVVTKTGGNNPHEPNLTVYANVDGVWLNPVEGSTLNGWTLTPRNEFLLGSHAAGSSQLHDGLLDEAAVYNKALTAAQIQAHYAAANPGPSRIEYVIDNKIDGNGATVQRFPSSKYSEVGTFLDVRNDTYPDAYWNTRDNYRISFTAGDKAVYTPGLSGTFDLQACWPVHSVHDALATYRVTDANGNVTVIPVNQHLAASQGVATGAPAVPDGRSSGWFTLGRFILGPASTVELVGGGGGVLAADAVRVANTGLIIDEWSANVRYSLPCTGPHFSYGGPIGNTTAPGADASGQYAWNPNSAAIVTYTPGLQGPAEISLSWAVHASHGICNYTLDPNGIWGSGDEILLATINQALSSDQLTSVFDMMWSGWYRVAGFLDLNPNSTIVQTYVSGPSFSTDALLIYVFPEPGTLVLLGGGLLALARRRRRK